MPSVEWFGTEGFKEAAKKSGGIPGGSGVHKGFTTEVRDLGSTGDTSYDRVLEFVITTQSVDRYGDKVLAKGLNFENFKKNPSVLFGHDHNRPPVAKSTDIWAGKDDKIYSLAQFTPADLSDFGHMIYRMYQEGFMNAVSIGFLPTMMKWADEDEENAEEDQPDYGLIFHESDLLEYSAVPVPANPEALIQAKSAKIDLAPLKGWAEETLDTFYESEGGVAVVSKGTIESLRRQLDEIQRNERRSMQKRSLKAEESEATHTDASGEGEAAEEAKGVEAEAEAANTETRHAEYEQAKADGNIELAKLICAELYGAEKAMEEFKDVEAETEQKDAQEDSCDDKEDKKDDKEDDKEDKGADEPTMTVGFDDATKAAIKEFCDAAETLSKSIKGSDGESSYDDKEDKDATGGQEKSASDDDEEITEEMIEAAAELAEKMLREAE